MTPVSRETVRGVALMVQALAGLVVAVGAGWFAFWGVVWAFVSWPLVAAEFVVFAALVWDATSPRPRLVRVNREGQ